MPFDLTLGDEFDVLLITGPNTGGKTVTLKAIGLLTLMAQTAIPAPVAEGSVIPEFDQIHADIGDEQSLQQSLSTFSGHLERIAAILRQATEDSLILLDELGSGTDPAEGEALGHALLDQLRRRRCRVVATTHLSGLKDRRPRQKSNAPQCVGQELNLHSKCGWFTITWARQCPADTCEG